jgi:5'-phosphate synthase pdxT subunit
VKPLKILPFRALRNHYGRQVHSFTADIQLSFDDSKKPLRAHFIRAPGISEPGEGIEVLARYNDEIIMIGKDRHLALSFHPELTEDTRIHEYWLQMFA